jgi:hypothetical protein
VLGEAVIAGQGKLLARDVVLRFERKLIRIKIISKNKKIKIRRNFYD